MDTAPFPIHLRLTGGHSLYRIESETSFTEVQRVGGRFLAHHIIARTWPERGPTWDSVFQTIEGGLGYWAGNHFRYGPPKFSMNATPQCYDYEVGSPGWSFFYSNEALPDNRLGIAQLSNRLLIPPDALPFQGQPNGEFLGYSWMALPFTAPNSSFAV